MTQNSSCEKKVFTEVIGNLRNDPEWAAKVKDLKVDEIFLDQWTAQKSRFLVKGVSGREYPVALKRHTQIADGDVIDYEPVEKTAAVLRIELNPVLVVDLAGIAKLDSDTIIRTCVELGHAIGNQHWPAVVKGTKVYVPLTVDKKVMSSVMETHNIPGITFAFHQGTEVIPYLAPNEIRELFGGSSRESHAHVHPHDHCHCHDDDDACHCHDHDHHNH